MLSNSYLEHYTQQSVRVHGTFTKEKEEKQGEKKRERKSEKREGRKNGQRKEEKRKSTEIRSMKNINFITDDTRL